MVYFHRQGHSETHQLVITLFEGISILIQIIITIPVNQQPNKVWSVLTRMAPDYHIHRQMGTIGGDEIFMDRKNTCKKLFFLGGEGELEDCFLFVETSLSHLI